MERDAYLKKSLSIRAYFNSHAHVERDRADFPRLAEWIISTHTLTWSVTGVFAIFVKFFTNFNSHAHVERDFLL